VGYRGGSGDPLVLIHGGAGTWRQWRPVIPFLERHHEVLAVNLVGHWGGAPKPPGAEANLELFVRGVERDMDASGWPVAHVVGTSFGAWVALELAKRGRARSCIAMAPAGGWRKGGDLRLRLVAGSYALFGWATQRMARHPERWSGRPRLRRLLYWHHFAHPERMPPADTAELIVGAARCSILPELITWSRNSDGASGLDQIRCPVLLAFPENDLVFPRARYGQRLIDALPMAEVLDLPGVGHVASWDDPQLVAQTILDFTDQRRST
jgi:pimeloyl-ACP methyl ester carboxylesterase